MHRFFVSDIAYYIPESRLTNDDVEKSSARWSSDEIYKKIGIRTRGIAADHETASDLAFCAARKLLSKCDSIESSIDLLLFCTQSPDYALPASACVLQERLGLPTDCFAIDFNQGCSGYVYGLAMARAMLESGDASRALLLTGETYSKWMAHDDETVRTVFGDAGSATLLELLPCDAPEMGAFVYGTDGRGRERLIVRGSGSRRLEDDAPSTPLPEGRRVDRLFMDGPAIFDFTLDAVPKAVEKVLTKSSMTVEEIDWVVFHQANRFMLDHLRRRCGIPREKFVIDMEDYGNTVSNTIPIALANLVNDGRLKRSEKVMLVGYGVGYSWAACIIDW
jgi:3-oxoacyl-[acyl-carrier-protein] synthase-3